MSGRSRRRRKARRAHRERAEAVRRLRERAKPTRKERRQERLHADLHVFEELRTALEAAEEPGLCQYCGTEMGHDDVVFCARCQTAHHRDCWREAGACTTFACGCTRALDGTKLQGGFSELAPGADLVVTGDDVLVIDAGGHVAQVQHGGTRAIRLHRVPRPPDFDRDAWEVVTEGDRELCKIDVLTPSEMSHRAMAIGGILTALLCVSTGLWGALLWALALAGTGIALWRLFDVHYVVDTAHRTLSRRRLIGGVDTGSVVGRLEDLRALTVQGRQHKGEQVTSWTYRPVAVFEDRSMVALAGPMSFDRAEERAALLAALMDRPHLRAKSKTALVVTGSGKKLAIRHEPWSFWRDDAWPAAVGLARWGAGLALLATVLSLLF